MNWRRWSGGADGCVEGLSWGMEFMVLSKSLGKVSLPGGFSDLSCTKRFLY